MNWCVFWIGVALSGAFASVAQAADGGWRSGDMFYDKRWIYDRPAVPSDLKRGQDMFSSAAYVFMPLNKEDVLSDIKPRRHYANTDMFPKRIITRVPHKTLVLDPEPQDIKQALRIYRSSP